MNHESLTYKVDFLRTLSIANHPMSVRLTRPSLQLQWGLLMLTFSDIKRLNIAEEYGHEDLKYPNYEQ